MSNLLKSKLLLGVMTVAIMFVGAVAVNATTAAASCSITSTLKLGSTGAQVVCLQTALGGLTADGNFGAKTKAAVIKFQTNANLTADGVFGPKSIAAWMGNQGNAANFPSGCTSASGFSTTTGMSCAGSGLNLPTGCTSTSGFSPVTGTSCAASSSYPAGCTSASGFSPTTGMSCSGAGVSSVNSTGEGTLTLQSAPVSVTTNPSQGDSKDTVLAFGLKATGSNVTVNRVNVSIASTNSLPWSYFTTLYLYNGGSLLGTLAVNNNTLTQNTFGSNYTASFQGLSSVIPVDQTASFIVKADIASTIPAASNSNNVYTFGLNDQSTSQVVRGTDGAGLSEYVGYTPGYNQVLTLSTSGNGTVSVTTDGSNPNGNNVVEQTNQTATGVVALVFNLKNTSNNTATVEAIKATINNVASVSAYYLYNGGTSIQSVGNPGGSTLTFDNFTPFTVAPNSTTTMTIKFDASTGASGTVNVAITGSTQVSALLNNTLTSVSGSATGNNFVLIGTNGVSVNVVGTPTFTSYPATVSGTTGYTTGVFTFQVSPVGVSLADLSKAGALTVVGTSATNNNGGTAGDGTWYSAGSSASTNYIVSPVLTNGISDGNSATITVTVNRTDTGAGNVTFNVTGLRFATTAWNGTSALVTGTSVGVTAGLTNATVTGYSNQ